MLNLIQNIATLLVQEAHLTADLNAKDLPEKMVCSSECETCAFTRVKAFLALMQCATCSLQWPILNLETKKRTVDG